MSTSQDSCFMFATAQNTAKNVCIPHSCKYWQNLGGLALTSWLHCDLCAVICVLCSVYCDLCTEIRVLPAWQESGRPSTALLLVHSIRVRAYRSPIMPSNQRIVARPSNVTVLIRAYSFKDLPC